MRTLVEQHPPTFAFPCCAPSAGIIITLRAIPAGDDPVDSLEFAVFAAIVLGALAALFFFEVSLRIYMSWRLRAPGIAVLTGKDDVQEALKEVEQHKEHLLETLARGHLIRDKIWQSGD